MDEYIRVKERMKEIEKIVLMFPEEKDNLEDEYLYLYKTLKYLNRKDYYEKSRTNTSLQSIK